MNGPGLTHNSADFVEGKLPFLSGLVCRHSQPAVAAVAVAAVGQIDVAFEGQARDVSLASDDVRLSIQIEKSALRRFGNDAALG